MTFYLLFVTYQLCPIVPSAIMKISISVLTNRGATPHMCYEVPEMYLRLWSNLTFNFILINLNGNSLLWLVAVLESCQVSFSNLKKKKRKILCCCHSKDCKL